MPPQKPKGNEQNLSIGPGTVYTRPRGETPIQFTPTAVTTNSFLVTATDAAKLTRRRHYLKHTASAFGQTLTELDTMPQIFGYGVSGTYTIVYFTPAFPGTNAATSANSVEVAWENLGYTDGGIELRSQLSRLDVMVDQEYEAVDSELESRDTSLVVPAVEMTDRLLALAMGVPSSITPDYYQIGSLNNTGDREDMFLFEHQGTKGKVRQTLIHRAQNQGEVVQRAAKNDKSIVNLDLKVMVDNGAPIGAEVYASRQVAA